MSDKVLMKGNEAYAEAAILAGCRYYFGYPITPQSEIPEYMSRELKKRGGVFFQAESELSSVNAAYGAAAAGGTVFVSSSSPGIALMQEGMSFLCSAEVPVTFLNVSRGGPGVGGIQPGQADYYQCTRGGGNGDYHLLCFAPANIQEAVDIIYQAPALAEKYRNPVMVLADGMMGQMMEPVALPPQREMLKSEDIPQVRPWALSGTAKGRRNVIKSLLLKPDELEAHVEDIFRKYAAMERDEVRFEASGLEDAEVVFVAFGTVARLVNETIELLADKGVKAGLIRPITLWPFPYQAFDRIDFTKTKRVISVELSMGQLLTDVKMGVNGRAPVGLIHRTGGVVPTSLEVMERTIEQLKEVR